MRRALPLALGLTLLVASAALAQVKLDVKRPEGTAATKMTVKVEQTLTIADMKVPTTANVGILIRNTTGKPNADGSVPVVTKTEWMSLALDVPGLKLDYDSAKPETAKSDNPMIQAILDPIASTVGKSYTIVFGKDHKVAKVEGVDRILETAPPTAAESLKKELSFERIKLENDQDTARLPDMPVKKGDRWMRTEVMYLGAGQTLTFEIFYEYLGTVEKGGKTLDKIGVFHSSVRYGIEEGGSIPLKVTNSDLKVENSSGSFLYDRQTGQVVESTTNVKISGPMTFSFNGMELPGSVDLTLETSSTAVP